MDDSYLQEDGNFKMNPPLRGALDRTALIEGIKDGTVDMIATDHAPHSPEEKSKGLAGSLMGIVGIETAFPILYTDLVKNGTIGLDKLVSIMSEAPKKRFSIDQDGIFGEAPCFTVFDLGCEYEIDPEKFISKGHNTPFGGKKVFGKCLMTVCEGRLAYKAE
jgi:dihydroorotase